MPPTTAQLTASLGQTLADLQGLATPAGQAAIQQELALTNQLANATAQLTQKRIEAQRAAVTSPEYRGRVEAAVTQGAAGRTQGALTSAIQANAQRAYLGTAEGQQHLQERATYGYAEREQRAAGQREQVKVETGTIGSPEHLAALRQEIALEKEMEEQQQRLKAARRQLADEVSPPSIRQRLQQALPALQGVGATASALGQLAQTPTSAMGTPGEAMSRAGGALGNIGQALTPFLPVAGGVVSALGSVVSGLGALAKAFQDVKPSLAELTGEMERAAGIRGRIAREGAPSGEDIRRTFGPTASLAIERAQNQGNPREARALVRRQTEDARGEVRQLEGQNLGELRSQVETDLLRGLDEYRSGARNGTFTTAAGQAQDRINQRLGRGAWSPGQQQVAGVEIPEEFSNLNYETATRERVRQLAAAMTTGQLTRAQQRVTAGEAIGREGNVASLRPGAFGIRDLPNLFQSKQGDVLDIHSQIQQEAVRDQREEARFQAQMTLWQQILEEQRRVNGQGGGPNVANVPGNIRDLLQEWGQAWGLGVPAVGPG